MNVFVHNFLKKSVAYPVISQNESLSCNSQSDLTIYKSKREYNNTLTICYLYYLVSGTSVVTVFQNEVNGIC